MSIIYMQITEEKSQKANLPIYLSTLRYPKNSHTSMGTATKQRDIHDVAKKISGRAIARNEGARNNPTNPHGRHKPGHCEKRSDEAIQTTTMAVTNKPQSCHFRESTNF